MSTTGNNQIIKRNTYIFGISLVLLHIAIPIIYGICNSYVTSYINVSSILTAIALCLLTIAGFGLVFSYLKRLTWSGIGFAFLITAFCVEMYPLINAFWTKSRIQNNPIINNFTKTNSFTLLVSNLDIPTGSNSSNTISTCFRCALAVLAAFSSILGRAGSLECLIVSLFGIIGFQLNRQIISNLANDSFGTFSIFTFGGFMGLALGVILYFRESKNQETSTQLHPNYTSTETNVSVALFGSLIIFVFFPFLAFDLDTFHGINSFNLYSGPLMVIVAMGASIVSSVIVSCMINGHLIVRDLIHAPIAGGIIAGSASFFLTNQVYALVVGFVGGAIQTLIQNYFEKKTANNSSILSTISWSLFGVQGLIGGIFATGYRNILQTQTGGVIFNASSIDFNAGYELAIALISAAIGFGFGLMAGVFVYLVNGHRRENYFEDREYWINDDGISTSYIDEGLQIKIITNKDLAGKQPAKKVTGPLDQGLFINIRTNKDIFDKGEEVDIYASDTGDAKNNFAYL